MAGSWCRGLGTDQRERSSSAAPASGSLTLLAAFLRSAPLFLPCTAAARPLLLNLLFYCTDFDQGLLYQQLFGPVLLLYGHASGILVCFILQVATWSGKTKSQAVHGVEGADVEVGTNGTEAGRDSTELAQGRACRGECCGRV
jgi:hypothetical protein